MEAAGLPPRQARDIVTALADEIREELATKESVRAALANLRYQMLAAHVASFIGLALLIVFRTWARATPTRPSAMEGSMIKGLHHNAWRCRDSEATRKFYEDFLGLPLASALAIETTKTGRGANVLHTFYEMGDGSFLAFFEAPGQPFEFKQQHDFDLHIALEVDRQTLMEMFERGKAEGIETRGVSNHGFIDSVYFRDPDGYVVELTTKTAEEHELLDRDRARATLDQWQAAKA